LEGVAKDKLGIFYGHLVYFTAIGNILWPFDIFCGNLVYFPPFWYFGPRKIWQPWKKCGWYVKVMAVKNVLNETIIKKIDVGCSGLLWRFVM
jgi:hypothetical protein